MLGHLLTGQNCSECSFGTFCNFIVFVDNIHFDDMGDLTLWIRFWFCLLLNGLCSQVAMLSQRVAFISLQASFYLRLVHKVHNLFPIQIC
jgi:hypothetical protein